MWSKTSKCLTIYLLYYLGSNFTSIYERMEQDPVDDLSMYLAFLGDIVYDVFLIVTFLIALSKMELIIECLNTSEKLRRDLAVLESSDSSKQLGKHLTYQVACKTALDLIVVVASIVLGVFIAFDYFYSIAFVVLQPLTLAVYNFVSTMYYIFFSYVLYLNQKLSDNLSHDNCRFISHHYQKVLTFSNKVHRMMQPMILSIIFDAFIELVSEVWDYT